LNVVGRRTTVRHCRVIAALLTALVIAALLITPGRGQAAGRVFSGLALTADGQGYSLTATSGEKYAFGTARSQPNPTGFSGRIVDVALTADGRGTMAVSSAGQFYAYGTARPQPNPKGFSGEIVAVALTADGQGAMAVSSAGQFYAYGTARPQPNPSGFSGRIVDVALTADGQGAMAVSSAGQFYAYGTAQPQQNPTGFSGEIIGVALTADGRGAMAVSSAGQFYAYGTAQPQQNPSGFSGRIVDVALTADGRGAAALSSIGQVYAYGSVTYHGNGDHGCTRYGGADVCLEIRAKYESLGGPHGFLGIPTSEEFPAGGGRGLGMHFQGGSIYWSPSTGAHEVRGAIRDRWAAANWENGFLGFPISDEFSAGSGRGRGSHFQNGSIYWSPSTGAHEVHGAIREEWGRLGWEHNLGFPVTDEHDSFEGADRASFFDNGAIYWSAARGAKGWRLPYHTNTYQEALTILRLPLPEFLSLRAVRSAFDPGSGLEVLDWTNDGCSGPTYQDVDSFFYDACLRHDFGWRNFGHTGKGLGLDPTQARKNEIDTALHTDALATCAQRGQPLVRFGAGSIQTVSCKFAADTMYVFVSRTPWLAPP
jgi:hypothetical protein